MAPRSSRGPFGATQTMKRRPLWWDWELQLSHHIRKRMADRGFTELELRVMLDTATAVRRDFVPDRWIVHTRHRRRRWEVILELDAEMQRVIAISAYPVEP